jgi:hypothetical protein
LYISSTIIISYVPVYFAVLFSERRLNSITDERGIRLLLLNLCNVILFKIASCFWPLSACFYMILTYLSIIAAKFSHYVFPTSLLCTWWSGKISFLAKSWRSLHILMQELYAIQIWRLFTIIWHGGKWTVSYQNCSLNFLVLPMQLPALYCSIFLHWYPTKKSLFASYSWTNRYKPWSSSSIK